MFLEPLDIADDLLEAQEQGKLVIFVGAGISMGAPSNLPHFKGLAAHIAGGTPLAPQIDQYENRLDRFLGELFRTGVDVQALCRRRIDDPASKPTELHRSLVDLFIDPKHIRIVTTNFDRHFRTVLEGIGIATDYFHAPALPLGNQFSGVVHLHGSVSRPEPLVLNDADFGRAYLTEGWAREFLQRLFAEFTTLFVGYSHNDLPVEYLARGMSGKSLAPRFALTVAGESGQWASLGIKEIPFEKTPSGNTFANLYAGLRKWADFTKQQPTEVAERVKLIVCSPEILTPDKSQVALLKRCLAREDSCHFFTREAKGWRWVKWLRDEGLLAPLFNTARDLTSPQVDLGWWLARALLAEKSDEGLLLAERYQGAIGRHLWAALCRELWLDDKLEWTSPLIQKWVMLLVETCPAQSAAELSLLLPKVAKAAPDTLGILLLRRLVSPRMVLTKAVDFNALLKAGDTIETKDKAECEVVVTAQVHDLEAAWEKVFQPRFSELAERLILLFENCLREAHAIYSAAERGTSTYDPSCFRGRIYERDAYQSDCGISVVLDCLLDVIEDRSTHASGLSATRIETWLTSGVPVLVRVGLYALHLTKSIPDPRKIELLLVRQLVHPSVYGATHEAWQVLVSCYSALNDSEKTLVWQAVRVGPQEKRPDDVKLEDWEESRRDQIEKLTWFLATKNPGCPQAEQAIKELVERQPGFRGYEGMDQAVFGRTEVTEGRRTPKSTAELVSRPPGEQMDFLLSYQGSGDPGEESREGLLDAVGGVCAQNSDWGIALLEELNARQSWSNDLWNAAFLRLGLSSLPEANLTWLLKVLEEHFKDSPSLQVLTFFLFSSVDLTHGKRPSPENLELMIRVSLLIWKQLRTAEPATTEGFERTEWSNRAINHPAGRIAKFWLKCCDLQRRESGAAVPGFPHWLKEPLEHMVEGVDHASQLGRAILGLHLPFLYHVDPVWTGLRLFPKLQFSKVGREAFLLWEPHASFGDLSRDLILVMPPLYREAFPHFRDAESRLQTGFFRHIVGIIYSCLIDVDKDNWFRDLLLGLKEEQRAHWARQMDRGLRGAPESRKVQIWQRWMNNYWEDRLHGRPCPLSDKEAQVMLKWVFLVGDAFPAAVELVVRGPRVNQKSGIVVHHFEKHDAPEKHPESVMTFLIWILDGDENRGMISREIETLLFRLPKKRAFLPSLDHICQRLASLGYPGAVALKQRINQEFTEA